MSRIYLNYRPTLLGQCSSDMYLQNLSSECWNVASDMIVFFSDELRRTVQYNLEYSDLYILIDQKSTLLRKILPTDFFDEIGMIPDKKERIVTYLLALRDRLREQYGERDDSRFKGFIVDRFLEIFDMSTESGYGMGVIEFIYLKVVLLTSILSNKLVVKNTFSVREEIHIDHRTIGVLCFIKHSSGKGHVSCMYTCNGTHKYYDDGTRRILTYNWPLLFSAIGNYKNERFKIMSVIGNIEGLEDLVADYFLTPFIYLVNRRKCICVSSNSLVSVNVTTRLLTLILSDPGITYTFDKFSVLSTGNEYKNEALSFLLNFENAKSPEFFNQFSEKTLRENIKDVFVLMNYKIDRNRFVFALTHFNKKYLQDEPTLLDICKDKEVLKFLILNIDYSTYDLNDLLEKVVNGFTEDKREVISAILSKTRTKTTDRVWVKLYSILGEALWDILKEVRDFDLINCALYRRSYPFFKWLLGKRPNIVNASSSLSGELVFKTCLNSPLEWIRALMSVPEFDPTRLDLFGNSCLHYIVKEKKLEVLLLFKEKFSESFRRLSRVSNKKNETPMDIAHKGQNEQIIQALES